MQHACTNLNVFFLVGFCQVVMENHVFALLVALGEHLLASCNGHWNHDGQGQRQSEWV